MRRYTNSELTTFKTCRRRWWLQNYRRLGLIREETVSAASLGTLVHLGLEAHYTGAEQPVLVMAARIEADRARLEEALANEPHKLTVKLKKFDAQSKLALTMVDGYLDWLAETGEDADLEVIGAERPIEVELKPGVSLLAKLDVKFRRRSDGAHLFMDHKTSASIETVFESAYRSNQFRTYALLEYLESISTVEPVRTDGVIVNVLRKVGRTAAAKPPFYGRDEFRINIELLRTHWHQVMGEIERIEEVTARLDAGEDHHALVPPNPSRDCSWMCQFKSVCPQIDDGSDAESVLSTFYVERDPLLRYGEDFDAEPAH